MLLQMKSSELGELYALLHMYQNVYGGVEGKLLAEIVDNYNISAACFCCNSENKQPVPPITNPRGAGRKRRNVPQEAAKIRQLRESGKTIRAIASETGRSTGYVHKFIYEHTRHDVQ